jgi:hypothetical protein
MKVKSSSVIVAIYPLILSQAIANALNASGIHSQAVYTGT